MNRYMLHLPSVSFFLFFFFLILYTRLYFFPGVIEKKLYLCMKNLYVCIKNLIVVNSLIIRMIRPDLPKSFHRNVHIYAFYLFKQIAQSTIKKKAQSNNYMKS